MNDKLNSIPTPNLNVTDVPYISHYVPLKQNRSNMFPLISAGIGAVGNIVSGLIGKSAQKSANQTNIQLQREQQAYNKQMWDLNNAYNTPLAQRQRMEEAGYNPFMAFDQGTTGNATSQVQSVAPAQVMSEDAMANSIVNSLSNAAHDYLNFQQQEQMIEAQRIDNKYREANWQVELGQKTKNMELISQGIESARLDNAFSRGSLIDRIDQEKQKNELLKSQVIGQVISNDGMKLENRAKEFNINFLMPQQLKNMGAEYDKIIADQMATLIHAHNETRLTDSQIDKLAADTALSYSQTRLNNLSYKQQEEMFPLLKAQAKANIKVTLANESEIRARTKNLPLQGKLIKAQTENLGYKNFVDKYSKEAHVINNWATGLGNALGTLEDIYTAPGRVGATNADNLMSILRSTLGFGSGGSGSRVPSLRRLSYKRR